MLARLSHSVPPRRFLTPLIWRPKESKCGLATPVDRDLVASREQPRSAFREEPLGFPASKGYGYFQGGPGLSLGPANRFKLKIKMGWGTTSNVWLAHDTVNNTYVAIKILTGYVTQLNHERKLRELEVYQQLWSSNAKGSSDRTPRLFTHFIHPGIEESDGEHLCLVTELFWANVSDYSLCLTGKNEFTPVPAVKRMLKDMLVGIARLHSCGIAHTDIKPDNIMIDFGPQWTTNAIDKWLSERPPKTHPPERSWNKMVSVWESQSFVPPTVDEISSCRFKLSDFSSAQFVDDPTMEDITPLGLRPPEVILGGEWNESVDIWTLGCIVFTLLTERPLFKPMKLAAANASEIDVSLFQMIIFCGEFFRPEFLQRCSRSRECFDLDCRLSKFQKYPRKTFEQCLTGTGCVLSPADLAGATDFMTKCLRLDPTNRASAVELLEHPWLVQ